MGRDPTAPLELVPLPLPEAPAAGDPAAWQNAPEVRVAEASARSAEADTIIAKAETRPRLVFLGDAGFWTDDTTHPGSSQFWDRFWHDAGYSFALGFVWNVWDPGAARARIAEANLGLQQSRLALEVGRRDARLAWEKAHTALAHLYKQIEILSRAVPDARDSYLDAQSRYRGGAATALEVLDAHSAAMEAAVRRSETIAALPRGRCRRPALEHALKRLLVLLALTLAACRAKPPAEAPAPILRRPRSPSSVAKAARATLSDVVSGSGRTAALAQEKIRAPFAGTLTELSVSDGDRIHRGDTARNDRLARQRGRARRGAPDGARREDRRRARGRRPRPGAGRSAASSARL